MRITCLVWGQSEVDLSGLHPYHKYKFEGWYKQEYKRDILHVQCERPIGNIKIIAIKPPGFSQGGEK